MCPQDWYVCSLGCGRAPSPRPFPDKRSPLCPLPRQPCLSHSCLSHSLCSPVAPSRSLEPPEEPLQTRLHRLVNPNYYGYQDAPWRIFLRKEVPGQGGAEAGADGGRAPSLAESGEEGREWGHRSLV